MVMGEEISRLMDGELEGTEIDNACSRLRAPDAMATWVCYHVIGDTLRGSASPSPGFSRRFAAKLAAEPTVLAPQRAPSRPATYAWAAAASAAAVALVGWVAFGTLQSEPRALARAGEAVDVRAPQMRSSVVPADYLIEHQKYSPTTQIQGVGPYFRSAIAPGANAQP
jgi:sigma-E factor negative regulatory protein RseA